MAIPEYVDLPDVRLTMQDLLRLFPEKEKDTARDDIAKLVLAATNTREQLKAAAKAGAKLTVIQHLDVSKLFSDTATAIETVGRGAANVLGELTLDALMVGKAGAVRRAVRMIRDAGFLYQVWGVYVDELQGGCVEYGYQVCFTALQLPKVVLKAQMGVNTFDTAHQIDLLTGWGDELQATLNSFHAVVVDTVMTNLGLPSARVHDLSVAQCRTMESVRVRSEIERRTSVWTKMGKTMGKTMDVLKRVTTPGGRRETPGGAGDPRNITPTVPATPGKTAARDQHVAHATRAVACAISDFQTACAAETATLAQLAEAEQQLVDAQHGELDALLDLEDKTVLPPTRDGVDAVEEDPLTQLDARRQALYNIILRQAACG